MGQNTKIRTNPLIPLINWTVPPDPQEIEQLRRTARLPWPEKLQWLEQMHRRVEFMRLRSEETNDSANDQIEK